MTPAETDWFIDPIGQLRAILNPIDGTVPQKMTARDFFLKVASCIAGKGENVW